MMRKKRSSRHPMTLRRFTNLRMHFAFEKNELPPTSPPPAAAYPFGFLSPASPSPEVHPTVGVMRVCASSSNVSVAQPHCFSTLGVSKRRASPSPLRGRVLSAGGPSPCRSGSGSRSRSSCHLRCHVRCRDFVPLCISPEVPTLSLRSLNVVPSRTYVPEMIQLPQYPVFRNDAAPRSRRTRDAAEPMTPLNGTLRGHPAITYRRDG